MAIVNKIYFRNAVGKLIHLRIPAQASDVVLYDLNNQQPLAAVISKNVGCAIMLPVLAVIK